MMRAPAPRIGARLSVWLDAGGTPRPTMAVALALGLLSPIMTAKRTAPDLPT